MLNDDIKKYIKSINSKLHKNVETTKSLNCQNIPTQTVYAKIATVVGTR